VLDRLIEPDPERAGARAAHGGSVAVEGDRALTFHASRTGTVFVLERNGEDFAPLCAAQISAGQGLLVDPERGRVTVNGRPVLEKGVARGVFRRVMFKPAEMVGQSQMLRELKMSVRRDLENLLNARWRCKVWPPDLNELETSLVNYGIPDFTGANLGIHANREEFRKIIERVIRRYEPRFKRVSVTILNNNESEDRTLRFKIDALLHAEPAPEPVVFESTLLPATAHFEVKRTGR
jgi:type VI secretion system protein ImpF